MARGPLLRRWGRAVADLLLGAPPAPPLPPAGRYGELDAAGPALAFRGDPGTDVRRLHADEVDEVRLCFNPWGWDSANSWQLVHDGPDGRRIVEVYEMRRDLVDALGRWCTAWLPGFDADAFAHWRERPGGDDPDVVVWRRGGDTPPR